MGHSSRGVVESARRLRVRAAERRESQRPRRVLVKLDRPLIAKMTLDCVRSFLQSYR